MDTMRVTKPVKRSKKTEQKLLINRMPKPMDIAYDDIICTELLRKDILAYNINYLGSADVPILHFFELRA